MKRQVLCLLTALMILGHASVVCAKTASSYSPVKVAIKKYKVGNYTGCLQDCQNIVSRDPSNTLAYYYMAMSYAQAGKKDEAINAYAKVLTLKPNSQLFEYASTGKRCIETPEQCHIDNSTPSTNPELDNFIASPFSNNIAPAARAEIEKKHLDAIKNEINSGKDVDEYDLRKLNENNSEDKSVSKAQNTPSDDEIVAALRVLKAAGLSPLGQQQSNYANPYAVQADAYQSPEMSQVSSMLGNGNNTNNNNMMNMLPFMLAQNKNGGSGSFTPQMMQAVIMNSMMPDFNFNTDKDK